jgi:DHA1 family inner membrane transport protein
MTASTTGTTTGTTTADTPSLSARHAWLALLALALGGFGIGCTEFVVMGLLPNITRDLLPVLDARNHEQAIAQGGWLIAAYALGVVVGAPLIAGLAARLPRKRLLVALLVAFVVATLASALLPSFELVLVARFVAGLPHGAYFGIAMLVAANILGPSRRAQGVAFVLSGLTIANVVGVPLITFLGQALGWRYAYLAVAVIFALALVCVTIFVPRQRADPLATFRRELTVFRRGQVWVTLLIAAIGFGGFFAVYSYAADVTTDVAGLSVDARPWVLACIGLGMTFGNLVGGRLGDISLFGTMFGGFAALAASLVAFVLTASTPVGLFVSVFFVGFTVMMITPTVQTRLMDVAGDGQSLAAALNQSAFNLGNTLGAWLGGLVIAAGFGFLAPGWVGLALVVPGAGLALASFVSSRRAWVPLKV